MFTINAQDVNNYVGTQSYVLGVSQPAPTVTSINPTGGTSAGCTSVTIAGTNFTTGATVKFGSVSATAVTVVSSTSITCASPAGTGTVDVIVTSALNSSTTSSADKFTYYSPVSITTATLPAGTVGMAYPSTALVATGGDGTYTWTQTGLPASLTLSPAGVLTGEPISATGSPFTVQVTATDGHANVGSQVFTVAINIGVVHQPLTLPAATGDSSYSYSIVAIGGTPPYTYAPDGNLPSGLTLNNGTLSGTVTAPAGTYGFAVKITDSFNVIWAQAYYLTVNAPTITVGPNALSAGTTSSSYSATITASGGLSPYAFSVSTGALPSGLTLSNTGTIFGTITAPVGPYSFTVQAADANNYTYSQSYTLTVNSAVPTVTNVTPASGSLAGGTQITIAGTDFTGATSVEFGSTPATNFTVNSDISITCASPAGTGTVNVIVTTFGGTSAVGNGDTFTYMAPALATLALSGNPSLTYNGKPLTYDLSGLALAGVDQFGAAYSLNEATVAWNATGPATVSGSTLTITADGTVTVTAAIGTVTSNQISITVSKTTAVLTTLTLGGTIPNLAVGGNAFNLSGLTLAGTDQYGQPFSLIGLTPAWSVATGASYATANGSSLAPVAAGSGTITVAINSVTSNSVNFTANYPTLTISNTSSGLSAGTVGSSYASQAITTYVTAGGGSGTYGYNVTGLPAGLNFSNNVISGIPTVSGNSQITVAVTDNTSDTPATCTLSLTVYNSLVITPASLLDATVGVSYPDATITATGGDGHYAFSVSAGPLPTGLTLNSGSISGMVTGAAGAYNFTVKVSDLSNNTATQAYSLTVDPAVVQSISATPATVNIAKGLTQQLVITATISDRTQKDVTGNCTYSTSNTYTVSTSGLVTGMSVGSGTITVTDGSAQTTIPVTVTAAAVQSISCTPVSISKPNGLTQQLTVNATLSDGSIADMTSQSSYSSNNTSIATVSASGLVTCGSVGNTSISVAYQGQQATVSVTVSPGTLSIAATNPSPGATGVSVSQPITITFSNGVQRGNAYGNITIKDGLGVTYNYTPSLSGNTLTLTPTSLAGSTVYTVNLPAGSVQDASGNQSIALSLSYTTGPAALAWKIISCSQLDFGNDWTCGTGFTNVTLTNVNKASTTITYDAAKDSATVVVNSAYPGYFNSLTFAVVNQGTTNLLLSAVKIGNASGVTTKLLAGTGSYITPAHQGTAGVEFVVNALGTASFTVSL